jgi:hypothetical protein
VPRWVWSEITSIPVVSSSTSGDPTAASIAALWMNRRRSRGSGVTGAPLSVSKNGTGDSGVDSTGFEAVHRPEKRLERCLHQL